MTTRGQRVIGFIEKHCRVPSGDDVGVPLVLEDFQRRFVLDVYDNPYSTRRGYLSTARKNAKTTTIACLVLAHVCGPEARLNTQVVSGAQSLDQAALVYDLAEKIIRLSPSLSRVTRCIPSKKRIVGIALNVEYQALSADKKNALGRSPVLAILDEIGQVEGPRDRFISSITTSQGAYRDALLLAISTQAATDGDLFSLWLDAPEDPRVVKHLYCAPEDCKLDDRTAWFAANPALGKFKSLETFEQDAKTAMAMPASEAEFRNLELNQRVESSTPFVSKSVWAANGAPPGKLDGARVWGGLDLSSAHDLTALVLETEGGDVHCAFWLPEKGLVEKSELDHVPYDLWAKDGLLLTTPGNAIEYEHVAEHLRGVFDNCDVQAIGFDRALMKFLRPWLAKVGFSDDELEKFIEVGQGTLSQTPALRALEVKLLNAQLKHGMHPILKWNAANCRVVGESGARKFDKSNARRRIDGMSALANCEYVMADVEVGPSFWEQAA